MASQVGTLEGCLTDRRRWYQDFRSTASKSAFPCLYFCLVLQNLFSRVLSISVFPKQVSENFEIGCAGECESASSEDRERKKEEKC